jgi:N-acetylneuraminic acid mutarotase
MSYARFGHAAGVIDGTLYVAGGNSTTNSPLSTLEAYDPATNSWSARTSMATVRTGLAAGVANGRLFAVGGYNSYYGYILGTVESYDPEIDAWTGRATMPTARYNFAIGVVNDVLYAVGGYGYGGILNTVEAYDPATNTWTARTPMPTARHSLAVGVADGILYAVGGYNGGVLATVEAYDPATDTWTTRADMPTARSGLAAGVVSGVLYAIGGYNGGTLTTVEAYDPPTDSWAARSPMPTARYSFAAGVVSPLIFAVGGNTSACCYDIVTVLEAYTAPTAPPNLPPTAGPGTDQIVHVGDTVTLNGNDSFDDNTAPDQLEYAWSFESKPAGSYATLLNADSAAPTFVADLVGTYSIQLVVTDEGGLSSAGALVTVAAANAAPVAHAGFAQQAGVGQRVTLDGTASSDPDGDALDYRWSFVSLPADSRAALTGAMTAAPSFTPDVAGEYVVGLIVGDGFADSARAEVTVTVASASDDTPLSLEEALDYVLSLSAAQFKAPGHRHALANLLTLAIAALDAGDSAKASMLLNAALIRTDGVAVRGAVDTRGPSMDWVIDPDAQTVIYEALRDTLDGIAQSGKRHHHRHHHAAKHHGGKHDSHHGHGDRGSRHKSHHHAGGDRKH